MPPTGSLVIVHDHKSSGADPSSRKLEKARSLSYVQSRRRQRDAEKKRSSQPWRAHMSLLPASASPESEQGKPSPQRSEKSPGLAATPESPQSQALSPTASSPFFTVPTHNALDPFYATIAGGQPGIYRLLHFAFALHTKPNFLAEAYAPRAVILGRRTTRHDNIIVQRLRQCVEDEALMYATLAYSASLRGWVGGLMERETLPEYFIGKALVAVRLRLQHHEQRALPSEPPDQWLLLSLHCLSATELWASIPALWSRLPSRLDTMTRDLACGSSLQNVRIHLNALARLVEAYGGWEEVEPYLLESCSMIDKFTSIASPCQPPIFSLKWDPGPNPPPTLVAVLSSPPPLGANGAISELGHGFREVLVSSDLLCTILDIAAYVQIALSYWSRDGGVCEEAEMWLFRRLQSFSYRLLSLRNLENGSDICAHLATIIFLNSTTEHHGPQVAAWLLAPRLQNALESDGPPKSSDLYLWCVCTGAIAACPGSVEKKWFKDMVSKCTTELGLDSANGMLESRLQQFLFVMSRQKTRLDHILGS